jgi:hypothetical protein
MISTHKVYYLAPATCHSIDSRSERALWDQLLHEARRATANYERRYDELQGSHKVDGSRTAAAIRKLVADIERSGKNEQIIEDAMARADDQRRILRGQVDEEGLLIALKAFENVQQIRLMRNVDKLDMKWGILINSHPALREQFRSSQWTISCEHAMMTLGRAYVAAKSKAHRFSSRFMDPQPEWLLKAFQTNGTYSNPDNAIQTIGASLSSDTFNVKSSILKTDVNNIATTPHRQSATPIADVPRPAISSLATSLTCLELQIDDPEDLNAKMLQLSAVFEHIFKAALKMEGLHIGLRRPITVPLETIFHNVTWPYLLYIGFSKWNLPSDQIIDFIRRHRGSLKSVRFREVRLKEGSWIEIVRFLRNELKLKWVSFRQVGYEPKTGGGPVLETRYGAGFAGLRGPPDDSQESSDESTGSDQIIIRQHPGLGSGAPPATGDDETNPSENSESEAPENDSDETIEAVDFGSSGMAHSVGDEEATPSDNNESAGSVDGDDHSDESGDSPSGSVAGDSEVGVVNEVAIDDHVMVQHSSATDDQPSDCDCSNGYRWEELEDDYGLDPTKAQWKRWERWVVRSCSEHDPKAT